MINRDRLQAITDGIIAVAATVMVLRLDIPAKASLEAVCALFLPEAAMWIVIAVSVASIIMICVYDKKLEEKNDAA